MLKLMNSIYSEVCSAGTGATKQAKISGEVLTHTNIIFRWEEQDVQEMWRRCLAHRPAENETVCRANGGCPDRGTMRLNQTRALAQRTVQCHG